MQILCIGSLASPPQVLILVDPRLSGQYSVKGAAKAIAVARACIRKEPKERPLMSDVVKSLDAIQGLTDFARREREGKEGVAGTENKQGS